MVMFNYEAILILLKLLPVFPPPPTDGKGGMERKPLSGKGLKRPGRLAAGKAEDRLASPPGPAGPLADLAFPSVRTQLGLWDFTSRRRHFFPLGAQKGRKQLKIPPRSR